jgi:hypothetical protein
MARTPIGIAGEDGASMSLSTPMNCKSFTSSSFDDAGCAGLGTNRISMPRQQRHAARRHVRNRGDSGT